MHASKCSLCDFVLLLLPLPFLLLICSKCSSLDWPTSFLHLFASFFKVIADRHNTCRCVESIRDQQGNLYYSRLPPSKTMWTKRMESKAQRSLPVIPLLRRPISRPTLSTLRQPTSSSHRWWLPPSSATPTSGSNSDEPPPKYVFKNYLFEVGSRAKGQIGH